MKLEAQEQLEALEATWSEENPMRAKVVIIRPGTSLNNRVWPAQALKQASESGFWNGTRMYLDHQVDRKNKMPTKVVNRSIRDLVSAIEGTNIGPDGEVVGDVVFFDKSFAEFARNAKDYMGPSVNLLFEGHHEKRQGKVFQVVESLAHSKSVDWVAQPGAGGAIQEFIATEGEENVDWEEVTAEMIREHRPDLVEAFEAAGAPSDDGEGEGNPPPTPGITRDQVNSMITSAVKEARESWEKDRDELDKARNNYTEQVESSGLPGKTKARLMSAFEGTYSKETLDKAIKEAREELEDAGVKPRVRGLGASSSGDDGETKRLSEVSYLHSAMESAFHVTNEKED